MSEPAIPSRADGRAQQLSATQVTVCDIDHMAFDMKGRRPIEGDLVSRMADIPRTFPIVCDAHGRSTGLLLAMAIGETLHASPHGRRLT